MQEINHRSDYREMRRKAYPKIEDQIDALMKGGADERAMRDHVLGIKGKYPKPADEKPREPKDGRK